MGEWAVIWRSEEGDHEKGIELKGEKRQVVVGLDSRS